MALLGGMLAYAVTLTSGMHSGVAQEIMQARAQQAANAGLEWARYNLRFNSATYCPAPAGMVSNLLVPLSTGAPALTMPVTVSCTPTGPTPRRPPSSTPTRSAPTPAAPGHRAASAPTWWVGQTMSSGKWMDTRRVELGRRARRRDRRRAFPALPVTPRHNLSPHQTPSRGRAQFNVATVQPQIGHVTRIE